MPEFKNRAEYEAWKKNQTEKKADVSNPASESPQTTEKQPRKIEWKFWISVAAVIIVIFIMGFYLKTVTAINLINAIIFLSIFTALFLILREIFLWYWKINKIVEKLDGVIVELKKIVNVLNK